MQENKVYRDDSVSLLVDMFQLKNCRTDFDEILCERHAIGGLLRMARFSFLHLLTAVWQMQSV